MPDEGEIPNLLGNFKQRDCEGDGRERLPEFRHFVVDQGGGQGGARECK